MSFEVSKHIFDFCADSAQERRLFILHGIFGTTVIILAFLCSIFSEVSWCKLTLVIRGHSRTFLTLICIFDIFFCVVAFLLYALPHAGSQRESTTRIIMLLGSIQSSRIILGSFFGDCEGRGRKKCLI